MVIVSSLTVNQAAGQIRWFTPQDLDEARLNRSIEESLERRRSYGHKHQPKPPKRKDKTP
jgi:hypothetical protein